MTNVLLLHSYIELMIEKLCELSLEIDNSREVMPLLECFRTKNDIMFLQEVVG